MGVAGNAAMIAAAGVAGNDGLGRFSAQAIFFRLRSGSRLAAAIDAGRAGIPDGFFDRTASRCFSASKWSLKDVGSESRHEPLVRYHLASPAGVDPVAIDAGRAGAQKGVQAS